jgi:hypothetical protein
MDMYWIIGIVAIVFTAGTIEAWIKSRERMNAGASKSELAQLNARLERMEKRLGNIETILVANDSKPSLEAEFEALERGQ